MDLRKLLDLDYDLDHSESAIFGKIVVYNIQAFGNSRLAKERQCLVVLT